MRRAMLTITLTALALGIYCAARHLSRRTTPVPVAATAPELRFTDLTGKLLETSSYKGKVVLINFWAAWCVPCADEIPQFMSLQAKYQDQGLQVIGISVDDTDRDLREFYRKTQMNYPVVPGDQQAADAYGGVLGLPTTFIIGRDNRIHSKQVGSTDFHSLESQVVTLLRTDR